MAAQFPATGKEPGWDHSNSTVSIPNIKGITYTVDGVEAPAGPFTVRTSPDQSIDVTVVATRTSDNTQWKWTHTFPRVLTPDAPTFDDDKFTIKTPSHWGVTYWLITPDGNETKLNSNSYVPVSEYKGQTVTVEARSNNLDFIVLNGTTSWVHTVPASALEPEWNDETSTIVIPDVPGVTYTVDGATVPAGDFQVTTDPKTGTTVTVVATRTSDGQQTTWTHTFPDVLTPDAPTFDDQKLIIKTPSHWGVTYWLIAPDGTETKLNSNSYVPVPQHEGQTIRVEARPNSAAKLLTGTTSWTHTFPAKPTAPEWNDETSTIVIPDVPGVTYTVDGATVPAGDFQVTTDPKTGTTVTVVATRTSDGQQTTWTHTFPDVLTPDAPTFDDQKLIIKTPSHWGVTYWLIAPDGTETKLNSNSYVPVPQHEGQTIRVEARPNSAAKLLTGTTSWTHTFPAKPTAPTVDKPTSTIIIPTVPGVEYRIDGTTVTGKQKIDTSKGRKIVTVTAVQTSTGAESSWELSVPQVVKPGEPKYDDVKHLVWVPGILHVNYWAVNEATGEEFKLNPNSWTGSWDQFNDKTFRVEARANNDNVYLVGTTSWKHSFLNRPADDLSDGDEFNGDAISRDWNVTNGQRMNRSATRQENLQIVDAVDNGKKIRALQITTMRHCLAKKGDPLTDANAQLDGKPCPAGKVTAYSSGNMMSPYSIEIPKSIKARVKLDKPHKGITFALWAHNDQSYCGGSVRRSDIGELDLAELWATHYAQMSTFAGCVIEDSGMRKYFASKPRVNVDLTGKWVDFEVKYDGRAITYIVDGKVAASKEGSEVTAEAYRYHTNFRDDSVDQAQMDRVMQDYMWRLVIGAKVPVEDGWAPFVRDSEPFPVQRDLVDYVRVEQWKRSELPTITATAPRTAPLSHPVVATGTVSEPGATIRSEVRLGDVQWSTSQITKADDEGRFSIPLTYGSENAGQYQFRVSVMGKNGFWRSVSLPVDRVPTASTAGTRDVGVATNIWGRAGRYPAKVFGQVKLANGTWATSQVGDTRADGTYVLPLTYGINQLGPTTYRVVVSSPSAGMTVSAPASLTRTPALRTAGSRPVGMATNAWGNAGLPGAPVAVQVLLPDGRWSTSQMGTSRANGTFVIPLTYGANTAGTYQFRVLVQTSDGTWRASGVHQFVRTPSATTAGSKRVGQATNVWGETGNPRATVFTEVQLPNGAWSRSQIRTTNASGFYAVPLTYGVNTVGTTRYRVAVVTPTGIVRSPSVTITRTR